MKYRKKPVVIEAIQFNGKNFVDVCEFMGGQKGVTEKFLSKQKIDEFNTLKQMKIDTLEGVMTANVGDYIIKGIKGEFYPCKPDIFEQTYELAE